jgi:hypothetical protein
LGIWSDGLNGHTTDLLQSQIGKTFGGERNNERAFAPLPSRTDDQAYDAGRAFTIRNAGSNQLVNGTKVAVCWGDWANGSYDWLIQQWIVSIKVDPRWTHTTPYVFAFNKEMNINNPTQPTCGTPEEYKSASRRIFNAFHAAGILWRDGGQVLIAWVPTDSAFHQGYASQFDPNVGPDGVTIVGDYYDLVGVDSYDRVDASGHLKWQDAASMLNDAHAYAVMRGKELIVPEFGVQEDAINDGVSEKAQVLSGIAPLLASYGSGKPGSVAAFYYTNADPYYPDTSTAAMNAFIGMANSAFFGG